MKLTKAKLKQLIKEELAAIKEISEPERAAATRGAADPVHEAYYTFQEFIDNHTKSDDDYVEQEKGHNILADMFSFIDRIKKFPQQDYVAPGGSEIN